MIAVLQQVQSLHFAHQFRMLSGSLQVYLQVPQPSHVLLHHSFKYLIINNTTQSLIYRVWHVFPPASPLLTHTHTHTHLTALSRGLPGWTSTRKVKPIWILLKQETLSGSWDTQVCTSLQTDNHASTPPLKFFYRPDALPATQPTVSKHWRQPVLPASPLLNQTISWRQVSRRTALPEYTCMHAHTDRQKDKSKR